jgi:hypothetical protein
MPSSGNSTEFTPANSKKKLFSILEIEKLTPE